MNQNEIKSALSHHHDQFIAFTGSLNNAALGFHKPGKWSAAQQVKHILKSVRPLANGLVLPKIVLRLIWGTANRSSVTFEELVQKYQSKLQNGGKAGRPFIPSVVLAGEVPRLHRKIKKNIMDLYRHLDKFSEHDLDRYVLPHPLLGKLTVREMMYFTIYHVQHHLAIIKKNGIN